RRDRRGFARRADPRRRRQEAGRRAADQKRARGELMQRYDYLKTIAADAGDALAVCTGWGAREWWALRPSEGNLKTRTLGLVSSIAAGLAIARQNPGNLIHLLFDNEIYEASGGTATASRSSDAVAIALGAGYKHALWVRAPEEFRKEFATAWQRNELTLLAVKVDPGQPKNLPPLRLD